MTQPTNPGDPDATDPEGITPEQAEAQADAAEEAAKAGDAEVDPALEAEIDAALSDVEQDAEASAEQDLDSNEAQLAERTEDLQRISAEYANYRRRTERERQQVIDNAKAAVLTKFLQILDDLDLAAQHGDLADGTPLKTFGDKFTSTLTAAGVAPFGSEGEEFNPEIHEAVQDLSSGDEKAIGTVLRKGYTLGDKVIRTAMVIIADAPSGDSESAEGGSED